MYDEHPVIQFDTIYEKGLYKIFAMMQVNVEKKQTVKYSTIRAHILSRIKKNLLITMQRFLTAVLYIHRRSI